MILISPINLSRLILDESSFKKINLSPFEKNIKSLSLVHFSDRKKRIKLYPKEEERNQIPSLSHFSHKAMLQSVSMKKELLEDVRSENLYSLRNPTFVESTVIGNIFNLFCHIVQLFRDEQRGAKSVEEVQQ